jgi:hypothetical protein
MRLLSCFDIKPRAWIPVIEKTLANIDFSDSRRLFVLYPVAGLATPDRKCAKESPVRRCF